MIVSNYNKKKLVKKDLKKMFLLKFGKKSVFASFEKMRGMRQKKVHFIPMKNYSSENPGEGLRHLCLVSKPSHFLPDLKSLYKKYATTLCLPTTEFPMRADAIEREPKLREACTEKLYKKQLEKKDSPLFVLHDGPPYANGVPHMGHALNKILKDMTNRYKILSGYKVIFIPGFDCHGLPIELKALEQAREEEKVSAREVRRKAREWAEKQIEVQKECFKQWGILGEWEEPYLTMSPSYEASQLRVFGELWRKGLVYRGLKPVYWSPSSKTALAEAELEYNDSHNSLSLFALFPVSSPLPPSLLQFPSLHLLIWTTTPWTLPANQAIAINSNFHYSICHLSSHLSSLGKETFFIIATERISALEEMLSCQLKRVASVDTSTLLQLKYTSPLLEDSRLRRVVEADYVTVESGTGLVHTAPSHGFDDYTVGVKYGLEVKCGVDEEGKFDENVSVASLKRLSVMGEGNEAVIKLMKENGFLLHSHNYVHKYPYDWRSKQPVILRATKQWFVKISEIGEKAVESLQKVSMSESDKRRLSNTILMREDWCLSRQRFWGVPLPVMYDRKGEPVVEEGIIEHVIRLVEKEGSDAWWEKSEEELLPEEKREEGKREGWRRGEETMDVWFDSGCSWKYVHDVRHLPLPLDLYCEGSDQHRGWFHSSLLTSVGFSSLPPYKKVITHGFVLDEQGRKMSKSLGNVINPNHIVFGNDENAPCKGGFGVDVLRLWVASSIYTKDLSIGDTVLSTFHFSVIIFSFFMIVVFQLQSFHLL